MDGWFGVVAPAHTPSAIVATPQAAVIDAAKSPEVAQRLRAMAMKPAPADSEEFARIIRADYETTGRIVTAMGLEKG